MILEKFKKIKEYKNFSDDEIKNDLAVIINHPSFKEKEKIYNIIKQKIPEYSNFTPLQIENKLKNFLFNIKEDINIKKPVKYEFKKVNIQEIGEAKQQIESDIEPLKTEPQSLYNLKNIIKEQQDILYNLNQEKIKIENNKQILEPEKKQILEEYNKIENEIKEKQNKFFDYYFKGDINLKETFNLIKSNAEDYIPFSPFPLLKSIKLFNAYRRLKNNDYQNVEQKDEDFKIINEYLKQQEEQLFREKPLSSRVVELTIDMIPFMGTFALTATPYLATKTTISKILPEVLRKSMIGTVIKALGGTFTRTAITYPFNSFGLAQYIKNVSVNNISDIDNTGQIILKQDLDKKYYLKELFKNFFNNYIENLTEQGSANFTIDLADNIAKKVFKDKTIISNLKNALEKTRLKLNANYDNNFINILNKIQKTHIWDGYIEEIGEEIINNNIVAITGTEDFNLPEKDNNLFNRLIQANLGIDYPAMLVAFSIPSIIFNVANSLNKQENQEVINEKIENLKQIFYKKLDKIDDISSFYPLYLSIENDEKLDNNIKDDLKKSILQKINNKYNFIFTENNINNLGNVFFQHIINEKKYKDENNLISDLINNEDDIKILYNNDNNELKIIKNKPESNIEIELFKTKIKKEDYEKIIENIENIIKEKQIKEEEQIKQEPIKEEPIKQEQIKEEPIKQEEKIIEETAKQEPVIKEEPIKQEPIKETVKEEPIKQKPIKQELIKEEQIKQEPVIKQELIKETVKEKTIKQEPVEQKEKIIEEPTKQEPIKEEKEKLIEKSFKKIKEEKIDLNKIEMKIENINEVSEKEINIKNKNPYNMKKIAEYMIVENHPNILVKPEIILEDRDPKELEKWRSRKKLPFKTINYDNIKSLYKSEKLIETKLIAYEYDKDSQKYIAHLFGNSEKTIPVDAHYYKWLIKEGYKIYCYEQYNLRRPVVLKRNDKIEGLLMILLKDYGKEYTKEITFYLKEKPAEQQKEPESKVKEEPTKEEPIKQEPIKQEPIKEEQIKQEPIIKEGEKIKEEKTEQESKIKEEPIKEKPSEQEEKNYEKQAIKKRKEAFKKLLKLTNLDDFYSEFPFLRHFDKNFLYYITKYRLGNPFFIYYFSDIKSNLFISEDKKFHLKVFEFPNEKIKQNFHNFMLKNKWLYIDNNLYQYPKFFYYLKDIDKKIKRNQLLTLKKIIDNSQINKVLTTLKIKNNILQYVDEYNTKTDTLKINFYNYIELKNYIELIDNIEEFFNNNLFEKIIKNKNNLENILNNIRSIYQISKYLFLTKEEINIINKNLNCNYIDQYKYIIGIRNNILLQTDNKKELNTILLKLLKYINYYIEEVFPPLKANELKEFFYKLSYNELNKSDLEIIIDIGYETLLQNKDYNYFIKSIRNIYIKRNQYLDENNKYKIKKLKEDLKKLRIKNLKELWDYYITREKKEQKIKSIDEEVEQKWQKLKQIPILTSIKKIKNIWEELKVTTRHFPYLNEKEDAIIYDILRRLQNVKQYAVFRSKTLINSFIEGLDKYELELYQRIIVLEDLIKDVEDGQYIGREIPLNYKNLNDLKIDLFRFNKLANNKVLEAIKKRKAKFKELLKLCVNEGILPKKVLLDNRYFHRRIVEYNNLDYLNYDNYYKKGAKIRKKSFQYKRFFSSKDYYVNYFFSEEKVLVDLITQLETNILFNKIIAYYDIKLVLKEISNKTGIDISELIPEDYEEYTFEDFLKLFKAPTISERIVEEVEFQNQTILYKDDIKEILSIRKKEKWILPSHIVKTLKSFSIFPQQSNFIVNKILRFSFQSLKKIILLHPKSIIKYVTTNLSGDIDIVLAYEPKILKYVKEAIINLNDYLKNKNNKIIDLAIKNGVISSNITAIEFPNEQTEKDLIDLIDAFSFNLIQLYLNKVSKYINWRENILRLSAYLYFIKRIEEGHKEYGVSNYEAINDLYKKNYDKNLIAAKLARELMGDYLNLSQMGEYLRQHLFLFWSWVELNFPRYIKLLRNSILALKEDMNFNIKEFSKKNIRLAIIFSKKVIFTLLKNSFYISFFATLIQLWNMLMFPDDYKKLNRSDILKLQLLLYKQDDGKLISIPFPGAFADFLGWFGFQNFLFIPQQIINKEDTLKKRIKNIPRNITNQIISMINPLLKMPFELIFGGEIYPDIYNPKPIIDPYNYIFKIFKLDYWYKKIKKEPTRELKDEFLSYFFNLISIDEFCYYHFRELVMQKIDKQTIKDFALKYNEKQKALLNYKRSIKNNDPKKAKYYLEEYLKYGGTIKDLKTSIRLLHPLAFIKAKDRERFLKTLTKDELEIYKRALNYYNLIMKRNKN